MAGSRTCEFYKRAAIIEKKKHAGEPSYDESRKLYNELNQDSKNNGKQSGTLNAKNKFCNNVAEVSQINTFAYHLT